MIVSHKQVVMKKIFTSVLFLLSFSLLHAQGLLELYGTAALSQNTVQSTIGGGGLGMGLYSSELGLIKTNRYIRAVNPRRNPVLAVRFGGDMMFALMGDRSFKHVPLLEPETGNANVEISNMLYDVSTGVRFSTSCFDGRIEPYLDLSVGCRVFSSTMNIHPDDKEKESTTKYLETVKGLNTGIGAGLMISLTKKGDVMLNAGLALNHSEVPGRFVDLSRTQRIGNTIDYYTRPSVEDFVIIRAGIVAKLDFSEEGSGHGCHSAGIHSCGHSHCGGGHSSVSVHAH